MTEFSHFKGVFLIYKWVGIIIFSYFLWFNPIFAVCARNMDKLVYFKATHLQYIARHLILLYSYCKHTAVYCHKAKIPLTLYCQRHFSDMNQPPPPKLQATTLKYSFSTLSKQPCHTAYCIQFIFPAVRCMVDGGPKQNRSSMNRLQQRVFNS